MKRKRTHPQMTQMVADGKTKRSRREMGKR
jgi:hypothetical protein